MTIESDIVTRLASVAGGRVYPVILPQDATLPAVTYGRVDGQYTWSLGGDSCRIRSRWQLDVWAETYSEARSTMLAAVEAMKTTGTDFSCSGISENPDFPDPDSDLYRASADFMLSHT